MAVRECLLVLSYSSTNCSLIRWHSPAPRVIRLQCQLSANTTFLKTEFNVSQTKVVHLSIFFKGSSGFRHILKSGEDCRLSSGIPKGMKEHATHPYCSIKRLRQGGCGEREGGSGTARRRWGEMREWHLNDNEDDADLFQTDGACSFLQRPRGRWRWSAGTAGYRGRTGGGQSTKSSPWVQHSQC